MKIRVRNHPGGGKSYQLDLGRLKEGQTGRFKQFKTRGEAEQAMVDAKSTRRREGTEGLSVSDADRARFSAAAERLAAIGASIEQAVDFYLKHHGTVKEQITIDALITRCVLDKAATNKRPRYIDQLKCSMKSFSKAGHGERLVTEIHDDDVRKWVKSGGWAPKTQKVYLTDLRTMFSWAIEHRLATLNPCLKVKTATIDDKPPGILTVHETRALLETALELDAKYELLGYFAVCVFAGIRPEETGRLEWCEIHMDENFIEVPARKSKTRRRRIVTISDNLAAWLKLAVRTESGRLQPSNFGKRFRAVRKSAKLTTWPHDALRHCFASYHLAKHGSAEKTSAQLGHEDTQMLYQHYRELVRPREANAFWEIVPPDQRDS